MPLYEYECAACGVFSFSRPMAESASPAACPACGQDSTRVLSAVGAGPARGSGATRRGDPSEPRRLTPRRPESHDGKPAARPAPRRQDAGHRPWMIGH